MDSLASRSRQSKRGTNHVWWLGCMRQNGLTNKTMLHGTSQDTLAQVLFGLPRITQSSFYNLSWNQTGPTFTTAFVIQPLQLLQSHKLREPSFQQLLDREKTKIPSSLSRYYPHLPSQPQHAALSCMSASLLPRLSAT